MERKEKGVVSERKKQEGSSMVKKLKSLVGKIGGLCSTPSPIWRLDESTNPALNFSHNSSEFHPVLGSDDNSSEFYNDGDNDEEDGDGDDGSR